MTIWIDLGTKRELIWAVAAGLFTFGVIYNFLIARLERKNYIEGFVSLAVVLGVTITLLGVALISWQAAVLTLGGFAASGAPMVAGSVWRFMASRREYQVSERQEAFGEIVERNTTNSMPEEAFDE